MDNVYRTIAAIALTLASVSAHAFQITSLSPQG